MERTEVAMVVLIVLVVYLLGVDIHESEMEAFLTLIRYNQLNIILSFCAFSGEELTNEQGYWARCALVYSDYITPS